MARAKQTGRAEARRRYRQSTAPIQEDGEGELLEAADDAPARSSTPAQVRSPDKARPAESRPPTGRLGFTESLRRAYHPVNLREDIRTLPMTLRSRGFLAAVAMVIAGGVAWYLYPVYSGSLMAWQLLVLPGSALAPQLVAGFFAPRASYLLGLLVGVVQPIVYLVVNSSPPVQAAYLARGVDIPGITVDQVALAFFNAIVMGGLFAAMAAWYRRFLSYSSQRTAEARAAANRRSSGSSGKAPQRRTAGR